ncbi:hypothetical protein THAOC_23018 [Thalassiosira oceanica]|uniref:Uncharacterized protein n=1 Tax=Thalassiosira oceanica TaxID=159749 RepID=K0RT14_THAOC|nr:hypothetical protein THAOC_23018 [Thalassiosira oceanica]|eukprot:EJK56988.1 hypothetical protein THAOC_23018 [Thalassiosira oceanica]
MKPSTIMRLFTPPRRPCVSSAIPSWPRRRPSLQLLEPTCQAAPAGRISSPCSLSLSPAMQAISAAPRSLTALTLPRHGLDTASWSHQEACEDNGTTTQATSHHYLPGVTQVCQILPGAAQVASGVEQASRGLPSSQTAKSKQHSHRRRQCQFNSHQPCCGQRCVVYDLVTAGKHHFAASKHAVRPGKHATHTACLPLKHHLP